MNAFKLSQIEQQTIIKRDNKPSNYNFRNSDQSKCTIHDIAEWFLDLQRNDRNRAIPIYHTDRIWDSKNNCEGLRNGVVSNVTFIWQ